MTCGDLEVGRIVRQPWSGGHAGYAAVVLRSLRTRSGKPSLRARILAALVAFMALLLAAPVVLVPLLRALVGALG